MTDTLTTMGILWAPDWVTLLVVVRWVCAIYWYTGESCLMYSDATVVSAVQKLLVDETKFVRSSFVSVGICPQEEGTCMLLIDGHVG